MFCKEYERRDFKCPVTKEVAARIPVALETEKAGFVVTVRVVAVILHPAETLTGLNLRIPDGFPVPICTTVTEAAAMKPKTVIVVANKKEAKAKALASFI